VSSLDLVVPCDSGRDSPERPRMRDVAREVAWGDQRRFACDQQSVDLCRLTSWSRVTRVVTLRETSQRDVARRLRGVISEGLLEIL
jgi:hypothetical protein